MQFTINSIKDNDTNVTFVFDDGSKSTQTIHGLPITSKDSLTLALTEYAKAYVHGVSNVTDSASSPSRDVSSIIGQSISVRF
jgi:hypothetical protein